LGKILKIHSKSATVMKKDSLVRIISGSRLRQGKIGIVITAKGTGKNAGKVEVGIQGLGNFWYDRKDLDPINFKTKLDDRVVITYVPSAITNVKVGTIGVVIKEPEVFADSIQVRIKLDDGQTIIWLEDNLELLEKEAEIKTEQISKNIVSKPIELIHRDGKTFAKVKDLRKHPLNEQIYDEHNIESLLADIKRSGRINALKISKDGKTISGNSRLECCRQLNIELVQVIVEEYKDEVQEIEAFLLSNSYRIKTNEELIREGKLREFIEAKKAEKREKAGLKIPHPRMISPQGVVEKGKTVDKVGKDLAMGGQKYSRGRKVVETIDLLKSTGRSGAAKHLKETLNKESINTAYRQLQGLKKVNEEIESLKKGNQLEKANELDTILQNHNIKDAVFLMDIWERERRKKEAEFQHNDVVRIKGKEHQGEWAILDIYDDEKDTGILQTVLGDFHEQLVNIEKIQLSEEEKAEARLLMERLQQASYNLETQGQPLGHKIIQDLLKKSHPLLNDFEECMLQTIENLNANKKSKRKPIAENNTNSVLNSFVKNLDKFGIEDIRVTARAISSHKQDAIVEATINLANNDEQITEIVRALYKKSPNAVKKALG